MRANDRSDFQSATSYDQLRLISEPSVLKTIERDLRRLLNLTGENAELRVLKGILEELNDRPGEAIGHYEEAIKKKADYASAYNSWGYTIVKWKLGGSAWPDKSLEKFKQAAQLKPDYAWPYINAAAVYLELADKALNTEKPDLDEAKKHLASAKENLEKAEKLLPDNPRVHLLWGHFHVSQARVFSARGLALEANQSYFNATQSLIVAKNKNSKIADVRVLLGAVYLEMGSLDNALYELREAVSLDEMNIIGRVRLVYCLDKKQANVEKPIRDEMATHVKRGLELINNLRQKFSARKLETIDNDAKEWLAAAIKDYDGPEELLTRFNKEGSQSNANSKRKAKKS